MVGSDRFFRGESDLLELFLAPCIGLCRAEGEAQVHGGHDVGEEAADMPRRLLGAGNLILELERILESDAVEPPDEDPLDEPGTDPLDPPVPNPIDEENPNNGDGVKGACSATHTSSGLVGLGLLVLAMFFVTRRREQN